MLNSRHSTKRSSPSFISSKKMFGTNLVNVIDFCALKVMMEAVINCRLALAIYKCSKYLFTLYKFFKDEISLLSLACQALHSFFCFLFPVFWPFAVATQLSRGLFC